MSLLCETNQVRILNVAPAEGPREGARKEYNSFPQLITSSQSQNSTCARDSKPLTIEVTKEFIVDKNPEIACLISKPALFII